jgi:hypothetical protein
MGKWEKFADDLEEEEALTKAPGFEDAVVDVVDPADVTLPPDLRGCQVIERRHPGGQTEIFYCRPDGTVYSEAQATGLIEAFHAAAAVGVPSAVDAPTADMVIDTLGTGADVPVQLRGAKLVDRGGSFIFITMDGTELPKEIGDSLFEAFESPEVTNPGLEIAATGLPPGPTSSGEPQPGPSTTDMVIDTLGEGQDVPPALRGASLVDRDGSFFFVTTDQEAIPKEIGDDLFDAWDAPDEGEVAVGEPADAPADAPANAPPTEAAPAAEEAPPAQPESAGPEGKEPAPEDKEPAPEDKEPAPEDKEPAPEDKEPAPEEEEPALEDKEPAPEDKEPAPEDKEPAPEEEDSALEEEILEFLGSGEDVPVRLRGARMVRRIDGFYYVTTDDEPIPADIGDELIDAWSHAPQTSDDSPVATDEEPSPSPLSKPFGYDDFGPVTVPNIMLPETIDVVQTAATSEPSTQPQAEEPQAEEPQAEEPQAEEPQAEEPQAEEPQAKEPEADPASAPVAQKLEAGSLEEQLKKAVTTVRREATTGTFDVSDATPTQAQMEKLLTEVVAAEPADPNLSRMVLRSSQLSEQIGEAWADDENRGRQALHRDVSSGTLLVVAVNPTQLKDLDVLGLLTLLRLRAAEGTDRVVGDLAKALRTKLVDDLSRAIKASYLTDQVLQGARSTSGVVTDGQLSSEAVTQLVAQTLAREISLTVGEVLGTYREKGYAFPGLAEKVSEAYRHFATDVGERVARAIE